MAMKSTVITKDYLSLSLSLPPFHFTPIIIIINGILKMFHVIAVSDLASRQSLSRINWIGLLKLPLPPFIHSSPF